MNIDPDIVSTQNKRFRKIQGICFFAVLLPLFLIGTLGWFIPSLLLCKKIPANLSISSFAEDVTKPVANPITARYRQEAPETHGTQMPSTFKFDVRDKVSALITLCGASCSASSASSSKDFSYSVTDTIVNNNRDGDGDFFTRHVVLGNIPMIFKCDYLIAYLDLSKYAQLSSPSEALLTQFSMTAGKATATYLTIDSLPTALSITMDSIVSKLDVRNHTEAIYASLLGPAYLQNVSGDIAIVRSTELVATNITSCNVTIYTTGQASLYWSSATPAVGLKHLDLASIRNSFSTTVHFLICIPVETLFAEIDGPTSLLLVTQGLSGSVTLTYYKQGAPVNILETSLITNNCDPFTIETSSYGQNMTYKLVPDCQLGSMNISIKSMQLKIINLESATQLATIRNNGRIDLHLYRATDTAPPACRLE